MKLDCNTPIEVWRAEKAKADAREAGIFQGIAGRRHPQYGSFTLTPAYGRVYTNKPGVLRDYDAGKDFISQPDGRYFNRRDAIDCLATHIKIRYGKRLEKVVVV